MQFPVAELQGHPTGHPTVGLPSVTFIRVQQERDGDSVRIM